MKVDKRVPTFLVGYKSYPQTQEIYEKLEKLSSEIKVVGIFQIQYMYSMM